MTRRLTNVSVLGSTGSIGRSTLEVIAASGGHLRAVALSAHANTRLLEEQARDFHPRYIVVTDRRVEAGSREDYLAHAFMRVRLPRPLKRARNDGVRRAVCCCNAGSGMVRLG